MLIRFQSLEEPLQERKAVLDESLQFYQFKRDVEDALVGLQHLVVFNTVYMLNPSSTVKILKLPWKLIMMNKILQMFKCLIF